MAIRRSSITTRLVMADRTFKADRHEELKKFLIFLLSIETFNLSQKEDYMRSFRQHSWSELPPIMQRLIEANLTRRHRFLYARRRWTKQTTEHSEDVAQPRKVPHRPSAPTGQRDRQLGISHPMAKDAKSFLMLRGDAASVVTSSVPTAIEGPVNLSHGARASTLAPSSTSTKIAYPKPPKPSVGQNFFVCPCCYQTLSVTSTRGARWVYVVYHHASTNSLWLTR